MTDLMPSFTDENGIMWFPVRHALGGIVCSLTEDSQRLWQEFADKQSAKLLERAKQQIELRRNGSAR